MKSYKSDGIFSALLNLIPSPVVIVDRIGTLLEVNTALEEVTGISKEKAIGKNIVEFGFFSEKILKVFQQNLEKRIRGLDIKRDEV